MTATHAGRIHDAEHLRTVPDGTIISWHRIPGDQTSEAVAFVRREVETETYYGNATPRQEVIVWISPGGWDPQTIEGAGVTFPCQVIRWGDFTVETVPVNELPMFTETIHGGTWAREKALECASRAWSGRQDVNYSMILGTAEAFETWLDRDPDSEALNEALANTRSPFDPAPGHRPLSQRLLDGVDAIEEVIAEVRPSQLTTELLDDIRRYAHQLATAASGQG